MLRLCDSVRALLAEANVKLSRVGGIRILDASSPNEKRAGIGSMQLDTQLEELRNLQVCVCVCVSASQSNMTIVVGTHGLILL